MNSHSRSKVGSKNIKMEAIRSDRSTADVDVEIIPHTVQIKVEAEDLLEKEADVVFEKTIFKTVQIPYSEGPLGIAFQVYNLKTKELLFDTKPHRLRIDREEFRHFLDNHHIFLLDHDVKFSPPPDDTADSGHSHEVDEDEDEDEEVTIAPILKRIIQKKRRKSSGSRSTSVAASTPKKSRNKSQSRNRSRNKTKGDLTPIRKSARIAKQRAKTLNENAIPAPANNVNDHTYVKKSRP